MNIAKYFWDFNPRAIKDVRRILSNPRHPQFSARMVVFLSRCDKPKELFSLISKREFLSAWPGIKKYWLKTDKVSDFRDWWQAIYEELLEKYGHKKTRPAGGSPLLFLEIGSKIKEARLRRKLSQKELSLLLGITQSDISNIEKGKKNITLGTLARLSRSLGIKKIEL